MVPSKNMLSRLKTDVYINAVRLFVDSCILFQYHSYPSSFALAILSLEELGKLEMVDQICDDISINPDSDPQEFLDRLFSRTMFLSHKNKQMWASDPMSNIKKKRVKEILEGALERAKQNAFYVGYSKFRIRSPRAITATKAYSEITIVYRQFSDVADLGFNGFDCWSDAQSRAKAKRWLIKIEKSYMSLTKPRRK